MSKKRRKIINDIENFALEASQYFNFVKASDEDCSKIFGKKDNSKLSSGANINSPS